MSRDLGKQLFIAYRNAALECIRHSLMTCRCPPASSAYAHAGYLDAGRRLEVRQQIRIVSVRVIACGARIVQLLLALQVAKVRHHGLLVRLLTRRTELRNRDGGQDADDHDHDEQLDQREALSALVEHLCSPLNECVLTAGPAV